MNARLREDLAAADRLANSVEKMLAGWLTIVQLERALTRYQRRRYRTKQAEGEA